MILYKSTTLLSGVLLQIIIRITNKSMDQFIRSSPHTGNGPYHKSITKPINLLGRYVLGKKLINAYGILLL